MNRIRGPITYPSIPKLVTTEPRARRDPTPALDAAVLARIPTSEIMAQFNVTNPAVQRVKRRLKRLGLMPA